MKFEFISDSADVSIEITADKQVKGRIGDATFVNGVLKKNWGLPSSITGVAYIVECGSIGSIYSPYSRVSSLDLVEMRSRPEEGDPRMNVVSCQSVMVYS